MLAAEDRLMGFAVVFESPHGIPEVGAVGGDHATFSASRYNFLLAEAPGGQITEAADGLAVDGGAMGSNPHQDPKYRGIGSGRQSGFNRSGAIRQAPDRQGGRGGVVTELADVGTGGVVINYCADVYQHTDVEKALAFTTAPASTTDLGPISAVAITLARGCSTTPKGTATCSKTCNQVGRSAEVPMTTNLWSGGA
jgi:hypothetical protein